MKTLKESGVNNMTKITRKEIDRMKTLYVICADPATSSCIVNAIYEDYEEAKKWVKQRNKEAGFELYWVESCSTYVKK